MMGSSSSRASGHIAAAGSARATLSSADALVVQPGGWIRQRVWVLDLLVATGVFLYNLPILPMYGTELPQLVGLVLVSSALCGSYMFRRRSPMLVLGIMLAAASVQLLMGTPLIAADVMLLFGLYNVSTRFTWHFSLPAAGAVLVWLLVAVLPNLSDNFIDIGQLGVLALLVVWVWTWGTLVRTRRGYISGLQDRAERVEREKESEARFAVAEERARIAREIHDIVSHSLSVVVVMSDGAASKVESEPDRAKTAMLTVRDTGRTALSEMRRMLGVLRENEPGSHMPQPGLDRLDQLVDQSRAAGLPVTLTEEGATDTVPESIGLAAYRIVQEALTNVRKHAGPTVTQVDVRVEYGVNEIRLTVTDDGRGATNADAATGGHGLLGMRERAAAHNGSVQTSQRPDGGFAVHAVLPWRGEQ